MRICALVVGNYNGDVNKFSFSQVLFIILVQLVHRLSVRTPSSVKCFPCLTCMSY